MKERKRVVKCESAKEATNNTSSGRKKKKLLFVSIVVMVSITFSYL